VGHVELAYDYFGEAALMDLHDLEHNARDGVHIASLAGAWIAAVAGLGGMRHQDGALAFAPRLPRDLGRLCFRLGYRGRRLEVEVEDDTASYSLLDGDPLEVSHHGEPLRLSADGPVTRPVPAAPDRERPAQPPGREPRERRHVWEDAASD
jgi:alpha,alpha-trehalose phosphorylase